MQNVLVILGAHIRHFRTAAKLSQGELARRTCLGKGYLSDVERGKVNVSTVNLNKIAETLRVPLYVLLEEDTMTEKDVLLKLMRKMPDDALEAVYRICLMIPVKAKPQH